jgi:hypothetical protein
MNSSDRRHDTQQTVPGPIAGRWQLLPKAGGLAPSPRSRVRLARVADLATRPREGTSRLALLRTVRYRPVDLRSSDAVGVRRLALEAQLDLLRRIDSPLLPEPLDWFQGANATEPGMPRALRDTEPVLVTAWQPGETVEALLARSGFAACGQPTVHPSESLRPRADVGRIVRLARKLVAFLAVLQEHGVVWFGLCPAHVVVQRDDSIRLLGLGSLCPIRPDGSLDDSHPNFLRTLRGYVPPGLTEDADGGAAARSADPASIAPFALGATLLQMLAGLPSLPADWLEAGTLRYPNPDAGRMVLAQGHGARLHQLLAELCCPSAKHRLTGLEAIDERLEELAGAFDSELPARQPQPLSAPAFQPLGPSRPRKKRRKRRELFDWLAKEWS